MEFVGEANGVRVLGGYDGFVTCGVHDEDFPPCITTAMSVTMVCRGGLKFNVIFIM